MCCSPSGRIQVWKVVEEGRDSVRWARKFLRWKGAILSLVTTRTAEDLMREGREFVEEEEAKEGEMVMS